MVNKETPYNHFKRLSIAHVKSAILTKKNLFDFNDTVKHRDFASERFKCVIDAIAYIDSKPLLNNDYFKYLNSFITHNKKLNEKRIHPCHKPILLYDWIFSNYTTPGQSILDTHLGSGSSRIAAYKNGFDFVGCEIDKEYFDAGNKRFEQFKAQLTLF
jgi:DNA modification methylase